MHGFSLPVGVVGKTFSKERIWARCSLKWQSIIEDLKKIWGKFDLVYYKVLLKIFKKEKLVMSDGNVSPDF